MDDLLSTVVSCTFPAYCSNFKHFAFFEPRFGGDILGDFLGHNFVSVFTSPHFY